jgi:nucleotide-binding universal stress UspA family protein
MKYVNRLANLSPFKSIVPARVDSAVRLYDDARHPGHPAACDDLATADSKINSILVPLDGSVFAEQAIPMALSIAEQTGAVLNLVHVIVPAEVLEPYDALYFADDSLKSLSREKHQYLESVINRITDKSSAFVTSRVINGRAVPASLGSASGLKADLVVLATHGRGTLGRFWSGSVAHALLQRMSVPVILVRGTEVPVAFIAQPVDHVLLPIDGSDASENVLGPIMNLGIFPAARHSLLHVVPLVPKHVARNYAIRTDWVPSQQRWLAGHRYLHPLAQSLRAAGRTVHTKVVSSDEPFWQVALRCAERDKVDVIAAPYRSQSSPTRLIWPNTSEYLFRNSSRPVMFVPSELA